MKRRIKKLKTTYNRFSKHPLTQESPLYYFLSNYLCFHVNSLWKTWTTCSWVDGLVLKLKPGDSGLLGNYYYGLAEFEESVCLYHFLGDKDIFFDIGANLGHYSLLLSKGKGCKSIAVEPVPESYKRLCKLIEDNGLSNNIIPLNLGVSDASGTLFFSIDKNTMNRVVDNTYPNSKSVPVVTLEALLEEYGEPSALKIDVEGYELFVLNGGESLLKNQTLKIIVMELNNSGRHYGISDEEIFKKVLNHGFVPVRYKYASRIIEKVDTFNRHSFNTIFIRDLEAVQTRVKESKGIKIGKKIF